MNDLDPDIKHMIVSVDAGGFSSSVMRDAVRMASRLQADLCGLFVEDTELLQLANLPFTREITLHTALSRELSSTSVERNLNAMAIQMRQTLEALAKTSNVVCTFRTVRGPRMQTVIQESGGFQLLLMMPKKRLTESRPRVAADSKSHPVVLFYDGSTQARRAIKVVKSMSNDTDLTHLLVLTTLKSADDEVLELLPPFRYHTKIQYIPKYNMADIVTLLSMQSPALLILPLEDILLRQERDVTQFLDVINCPLILVR